MSAIIECNQIHLARLELHRISAFVICEFAANACVENETGRCDTIDLAFGRPPQLLSALIN